MLFGCAAQKIKIKSQTETTPRILLNSVESLAVICREESTRIIIKSPTTGELVKRGAIGFSMGTPCHDPLCVLLVPITLPLGAAYGAVVAAPTEEVEESESEITTAAIELASSRKLTERIEHRLVWKTGLRIIALYGENVPRSGKTAGYAKFVDFAVDAVLEIESVAIAFRLRSISGNPRMYIDTKVDTRLVSVPNGQVIWEQRFNSKNYRDGVDFVFPDESHTFFKLTENNAALLRKFIDKTFDELADRIASFYRPVMKY